MVPSYSQSPGGAVLVQSQVVKCRYEQHHGEPSFKRDAIWFLNTIYGTRFQIKCDNFVAVGLTIIPLFHWVVWGQVNGYQSPNEHALFIRQPVSD